MGGIILQILVGILVILVWKLVKNCYIAPIRAYKKLRNEGFGGPTPNFPLGNLGDMKNMLLLEKINKSSHNKEVISHDIHSSSLPYFSHWKKLHGKVFVYWMGVEPFLYVADPEFLKQMSGRVVAKNWGKPDVFKNDRIPMFGEYGLNMIEATTWVRHRHIITPAFSPDNLKGMVSTMVESTTKMMDKWTSLLSNSDKIELDIERETSTLAGKIIARTNFGIENEAGNLLFEKLRAMQISLFKHTRYVGVPYGHLMCMKQTLEAKKLGQEIDDILLSIINDRRKVIGVVPQHDLLGLLLESGDRVDDSKFGEKLTSRELIDECKTFFFGGHETVALAMTWTLMLLAMYPKWQDELREEIKQVIGEKDDDEIDFTMLVGLKKMGWVLSEVLRLYPSSPNAQRQTRGDVQVGNVVIPNGTNLWIDVVGMHHDRDLWGDDVNEFKPERFDDNLHGGCKHKMGYLPFGFGGRMCIGRNYAFMEYKIVMSSILRKFSFSVSPSYVHCPTYFFSFRPGSGVPLIVKPL